MAKTIVIKLDEGWDAEFTKRTEAYKDHNWPNDTEQFSDFIKGKGIGGIGQSYFQGDGNKKVKDWLKQSKELIRKIKTCKGNIANRINLYKKFQEGVLKVGERNCWMSVHAMIVALQPDFLCNVLSEQKIDKLYDLLRETSEESEDTSSSSGLDGQETITLDFGNNWKTLSEEWKEALNHEKENTSWYYKSAAIYKYFIACVGKDNYKCDICWQTLIALSGDERIKKMAERLELQNNIIFTGAPGTGKTYLAKKVALFLITRKIDFKNLTDKEKEKFDNQFEFVQFHPSYDYTDFVEGLRPISKNNNLRQGLNQTNEIGFELKDGVFKKFCEKALNDWNDCYNKINDLIKDKCIKKSNIDKLVDAIKEANDGFTFDGISEKEYFKTQLSDEECSKNYIFVEKATKKFAPKYVFIIDEINRGELSKIFGELFFSIDPGYRGPSGAVLTQYANMVKRQNVFDQTIDPNNRNKKYCHFFVPKNVYIIGTMNDIDRSVESMDFAFRRRFAFHEITAEDSENIIYAAPESDEIGKKTGWDSVRKQNAVDKMENLNKSIVKKCNLPEQYQIGGAYFLKLREALFNFNRLWNNYLAGTLYEYFRGFPSKEIEEKMKILKDAYDNGGDGNENQ